KIGVQLLCLFVFGASFVFFPLLLVDRAEVVVNLGRTKHRRQLLDRVIRSPFAREHQAVVDVSYIRAMSGSDSLLIRLLGIGVLAGDFIAKTEIAVRLAVAFGGL